MQTAVDSSILLDVVVNDPFYAPGSEAALRTAMSSGALVVCECVIAEIRPAFRVGEIEQFLDDWAIDFIPSSRQCALRAGEMFERYLSRRPQGKAAGRIIPDFLVGSHAREHADRLLTRDRVFYRDYFRDLVLIEP